MNYRFFISCYDEGNKSFLSDTFSIMKYCKKACNEYIELLLEKDMHIKNICIIEWVVEQDNDEESNYTWEAHVVKNSVSLIYVGTIFATCDEAINNVKEFMENNNLDYISKVIIRQVNTHTLL